MHTKTAITFEDFCSAHNGAIITDTEGMIWTFIDDPIFLPTPASAKRTLQLDNGFSPVVQHNKICLCDAEGAEITELNSMNIKIQKNDLVMA